VSSRSGPRKRTRTRRSAFVGNETPLPRPAKRGAGSVHPNSMAARKLGKTVWYYEGEGR
jgi:hypothetical protein